MAESSASSSDPIALNEEDEQVRMSDEMLPSSPEPEATKLKREAASTEVGRRKELEGHNTNLSTAASEKELVTDLTHPLVSVNEGAEMASSRVAIATPTPSSRLSVMNSESDGKAEIGVGDLLAEAPDDSDEESEKLWFPQEVSPKGPPNSPGEALKNGGAESPGQATSPPLAAKDPPAACCEELEIERPLSPSTLSAVERAVAVMTTCPGEHHLGYPGKSAFGSRTGQLGRSGSNRSLRGGGPSERLPPSQFLRRSVSVPSSQLSRTLPSMPSCSSLGSATRSHPIQPKLLSLPVDSLHCIGSFLTPKDWSSFGLASRGAGRACREVFRRVRMHGYRCATEVVASWALGEHADARELSALYVRSGVPIYPLSLGHSYQTLIWRMGIESKEMANANEASSPDNNEAENDQETGEGLSNSRAKLDRFYTERYDARTQEAYFVPSLTYVEEKCLFWRNRIPDADDDVANMSAARRHSLSNAISLRPPRQHHLGAALNSQQGLFGLMPALAAGAPLPPQFAQAQHAPDAGDDVAPVLPAVAQLSLSAPRRAMSVTSPASGSQDANSGDSKCPPQRNRSPSMTVRVHRHLADAHVLRRTAVNDEAGSMRASTISLSADFFHPMASLKHTAVDTMSTSAASFLSSMPFDPSTNTNPEPTVQSEDEDNHFFPPISPNVADAASAAAPVSDSETAGDTHTPALTAFTPNRHSTSLGAQSTAANHNSVGTPAGRIPAMADILLEIYTSSSPTQNAISQAVDLKKGTSDPAESDAPNMMDALRARFAYYQRKLDSLLAHFDSFGFDECLLDFWDEFFPLTSGVHFYDKHTPVPRATSLRRFLTKPCPKAIGVVQCEIERIKTSSKRKGVGVKGRLFPTYEYRLFIRDRRNEESEQSSTSGNLPARRDMVLIAAKNLGKNHHGVGHSSSGSKRGVNNYYLHMPHYSDIEKHYEFVNAVDGSSNALYIPPIPIGIGAEDGPELGRVQSNFIGTEFQIFSPCLVKQRVPNATTNGRSTIDRSVHSYADSGDEGDGDVSSIASSMGLPTGSPEPRRKSRSNAFARRLSNGGRSPSRGRRGNREDRSRSPSPRGRKTRRGSWPNLGRSSRASRRMVANSTDSGFSAAVEPVMGEEENGVITYTANLLGNRPRIMDVCIPKVDESGVSGEWRRHVESAGTDGHDSETMINRFKQLQHQGLQANVDNPAGEGNGGGNPDEYGLMALQNRPPWWNVELGAFVLNFGGRVSVASVKNFQLCDRNDLEHVMLQFGRIQGRHSFTMDFQYPLSAVQAFAIAISSLQSRISFG